MDGCLSKCYYLRFWCVKCWIEYVFTFLSLNYYFALLLWVLFEVPWNIPHTLYLEPLPLTFGPARRIQLFLEYFFLHSLFILLIYFWSLKNLVCLMVSALKVQIIFNILKLFHYGISRLSLKWLVSLSLIWEVRLREFYVFWRRNICKIISIWKQIVGSKVNPKEREAYFKIELTNCTKKESENIFEFGQRFKILAHKAYLESYLDLNLYFVDLLI